MAGCKQGLLFQKCKLLSWGTPWVHTLHHPLGRKQFRKETGVCITQRNNIKSQLPSIWIDEKSDTVHKQRHRNLASSICGAKKKQLPTQHTKNSPPHRGNPLQCQTLQQELHRPGLHLLRTGPGTPHLHVHLDAAAVPLQIHSREWEKQSLWDHSVQY